MYPSEQKGSFTDNYQHVTGSKLVYPSEGSFTEISMSPVEVLAVLLHTIDFNLFDIFEIHAEV